MADIHIKHTHFQIPVELRFLGIPTHWLPRTEKMSGDRMLVPAVNQRVGRGLAKIGDPRAIRTEFFKMKRDDDSAVDFLNGVGVWTALEDPHVAVLSDGTLVSGDCSVGRREMLLTGSFGHRHFVGRALPLTLEELFAEQERWRGLLRNPAKLRAEFLPAPSGDKVRPSDKNAFALQTRYVNTLPVHLEWKGRHPCAVVQPITGKELLIATAWIDLVTGATFKVCAKCGVEYTGAGSKYCTWQCEHASTVSRWRKKQQAERRKTLRKKSTRLRLPARSGSRATA